MVGADGGGAVTTNNTPASLEEYARDVMYKAGYPITNELAKELARIHRYYAAIGLHFSFIDAFVMIVQQPPGQVNIGKTP